MMTGDKVSATDAEKMGMIYKVFADEILRLALERKYGNVTLLQLDDTLENLAHQSAKSRPRCPDGEIKSLSTFSRNKYFVLFSFSLKIL